MAMAESMEHSPLHIRGLDRDRAALLTPLKNKGCKRDQERQQCRLAIAFKNYI